VFLVFPYTHTYTQTPSPHYTCMYNTRRPLSSERRLAVPALMSCARAFAPHTDTRSPVNDRSLFEEYIDLADRLKALSVWPDTLWQQDTEHEETNVHIYRTPKKRQFVLSPLVDDDDGGDDGNSGNSEGSVSGVERADVSGRGGGNGEDTGETAAAAASSASNTNTNTNTNTAHTLEASTNNTTQTSSLLHGLHETGAALTGAVGGSVLSVATTTVGLVSTATSSVVTVVREGVESALGLSNDIDTVETSGRRAPRLHEFLSLLVRDRVNILRSPHNTAHLREGSGGRAWGHTLQHTAILAGLEDHMPGVLALTRLLVNLGLARAVRVFSPNDVYTATLRGSAAVMESDGWWEGFWVDAVARWESCVWVTHVPPWLRTIPATRVVVSSLLQRLSSMDTLEGVTRQSSRRSGGGAVDVEGVDDPDVLLCAWPRTQTGALRDRPAGVDIWAMEVLLAWGLVERVALVPHVDFSLFLADCTVCVYMCVYVYVYVCVCVCVCVWE
jgi:hypothetical protein